MADDSAGLGFVISVVLGAGPSAGPEFGVFSARIFPLSRGRVAGLIDKCMILSWLNL